jgi:hypothetical protein
MKLSQMLKTALVAGAGCFLLSGCLVSAPPPVRAVSYDPGAVYHEGYTVHYDSAGPYVYAGRTPRYVPRQHPRYPELVRHTPRRYRRY